MLSPPLQSANQPITTTIADLDALEAQIMEEERQLQALKESLDRAGMLTKRLVRTLDEFDDRIAELDPVIMPIFRTMQGISVVNTNVQGTVVLLKKIEGYNQLAEEEEDLIIRGPTVENVSDYLGAINRVTDALADMKKNSLDFCTSTQSHLVSVSQTGVTKTVGAFTEWLTSASIPMDSERAAAIDEALPPALSDEQSTALKLISGFAAASDDQKGFTEIMASYCKTRGTFLKKSLEEALEEAKDSISERRGTYHRGSHPFVHTLKLVAKFLREEDMFAHNVLPGMLIEETLRKTVGGISDEIFVMTQSLAGSILKALDKREFSDHVFCFDVIEAFNDTFYSATSSLASLKSSLQFLTQTGVTFLTRFKADIESEARQGSSLPTPTNSTVFEQTSGVLNCLKRMLEYERVIETMLRKTDPSFTDRWDGLLGPIDSTLELTAMPVYYQECLKALELALEHRSKSYRKPISALIFRLNNYRHISKIFTTTTTLSTMLTPDTESRYQSVVQQLRDQYLNSWKVLACILLPDAYPEVIPMLPSNTAAKERLKVFMNEIDETLKLQSPMAMPDSELRVQLKEQVKDIVQPVFQKFFQDNQTVFMALASKNIKYDADALSDQLASLFTA